MVLESDKAYIKNSLAHPRDVHYHSLKTSLKLTPLTFLMKKMS
jgi:hypothetical protein